MDQPSAKVLAVLNDLMFTVKIQEAVKRAGMEPVFAKSHAEALEKAKLHPALIILDLNFSAADPLGLIAAWKSDTDLSKIRLLAFVSHVQVDLRQAALEKGCDQVVARSAFEQTLRSLSQLASAS